MKNIFLNKNKFHYSSLAYTLNKKIFSTTSIRCISGGEVMLAAHAPLTPIFVMALILGSFTLVIGGFLTTELSNSAIEAQDLVMFPENLEGPFFFVPDYTMNVLHRYIFRINQALNY